MIAWNLVAARCRAGAATLLVAIASLLLAETEVKAATPITLSVEASTVVGNGTNQVVFVLSWEGSFPDGELFVFDLLDPEDALADDFLEGTEGERELRTTGPQRLRSTTRLLPRGSPDRVVTFTLRSVYPYSIPEDMNTVQVTVTAPSYLSVSAQASSVVGGSGDALFVISRDEAEAEPLTVNFTMTGDEAAYHDYDNRPSMATIAENSSFVWVMISTAIQAQGASTSITLTIDPNSAYLVAESPDNSAAVSVINQPDLPEVLVEVTTANADPIEGSDAIFTLTRRLVTTGVLNVVYTVTQTAGDMLSAGNQSPITGTAMFAAGNSTSTVTVPTQGDELDEIDAVLQIALAGSSATYTLGAVRTADITVMDDDDPPTVSIEGPAPATVAEGQNMSFMVRLSEASGKVIGVGYTLSGTATLGAAEDYTASPENTVTVAAGSTAATITVATRDDSIDEFDETVTVTLGSLTDATLTDTVAEQSATGTIQDFGDDPSVLSISGPLGAVDEGETLTFTVVVTPRSGKVITVPYSVTGSGTHRAESVDYRDATTTDGILEIPANSATAEIQIEAENDSLDEFDETLTVELLSTSALANATISTVTASRSADGTIADTDRQPRMSISRRSAASVTEGENLQFTITLSPASSKEVRVIVEIAGSGNNPATSGDYTAPMSDTVTFSPGDTEKQLTLATIDDTGDEPAEDLTVSLGDLTNADPATNTLQLSATGTIDDNDVPELSILDSFASEGDDITFRVTKNIVSWQTIGVSWTLNDDTATSRGASADYTNSGPGLLSFSPMETEKTFTVATAQNDDEDGNRTFTATLSGVTPEDGATLSRDTATGTVVDDELQTVSVTGNTPREGMDAVFTLARSGPMDSAITVPFTVVQTEGDMLPASSTLPTSVTIAVDRASATVSVPTQGDSVYEADAVLRLSLSTPASGAGYNVVSPNFVDIIVSDDDEAPLLAIGSPSVTEGEAGGAAVLQFVIEKSGATTLPAMAEFEITGTASATGNDRDFIPPTVSQVTIAAADVTASIDIAVNDDNLAELSETVIVTLSSPSDARFASEADTIVGTGTITDDDDLELSISDASATEGSPSQTSTMTFSVTLGAETSWEITVDYDVAGDGESGNTATEGMDFNPINTKSLTFAPGRALTQTFEVTVNGDDEQEGHETLTASLSNLMCGSCPAEITPSIAADTGTGTILDDDVPQISITSPSVSEGAAGETAALVFEVKLSAVWSQPVTVDYRVTGGTATVGVDYEEPDVRMLTFAPGGDLTEPLTVTVIGDADPEDDETVVITLDNLRGGVVFAGAESSITGTGTIESDDFSLSVEGPSGPVKEPATGTGPANLDFTVRLSPAAEGLVTVMYAFSGTAAEGADFTDATPDAADSVLTFAPGDTSKIVRAQVNSDFVADDMETVTVTLSNAEGAAIKSGEASASGMIERADSTASAATLSVSSPRVAGGEDGGPPVVEFRLILSTEQSGAVTVDWVLNAFTRTAAGGELGSGSFARRAAASGRNIVSSELASGNANVPIGDTSVDVRELMAEGTTLGGIQGQLVLELGKPSVDDVEISQTFVVESDVQAEARISNRVAVVVLDVSGSDGTSADFVAISAISAFGRSAGISLVDTVWSRAEAHRHGSVSSYARLGGRSVDTSAFSKNAGIGRATRETARLLGIETSDPVLESDDWSVSDPRMGGNFDDFRRWASISDSDGIARNTSFALALGEGTSSGSNVVYWGAGKNDSYGSELEEDEFEALTVDGSTTAISLGIDYRRNASMLLGLAVSSISGSTKYSFSDSNEEGEVDSSLTNFTPWLRWRSQGGMEVWGAIGIGSGSAEAMQGSDTVELDLGAQIIAVGLWNQVATIGSMGVAAKADAFTASMSVDGGTDAVNSGDANSQRIRLAAEMSPGQAGSASRQLEYTLEVGARSDSGEAASGAGLDAAADFSYVSQSGSFQMSGRGSLVVFHGQEGFSETGLGLGFSYDPGGDSRGLQLSLEPTWNASQLTATDSMWNADAIGSIGRPAEEGAGVAARIGYDLTALRGQALATPYGEAKDGNDSRNLRLGMEFRGATVTTSRLRLKIYGELAERGSREPESRAMLEGSLSL